MACLKCSINNSTVHTELGTSVLHQRSMVFLLPRVTRWLRPCLLPTQLSPGHHFGQELACIKVFNYSGPLLRIMQTKIGSLRPMSLVRVRVTGRACTWQKAGIYLRSDISFLGELRSKFRAYRVGNNNSRQSQAGMKLSSGPVLLERRSFNIPKVPLTCPF